MVDESTSVTNARYLIIYVRTMHDGLLCTYFLGLLPITNATTAGLERTLIQFLVKKMSN